MTAVIVSIWLLVGVTFGTLAWWAIINLPDRVRLSDFASEEPGEQVMCAVAGTVFWPGLVFLGLIYIVLRGVTWALARVLSR